MIDKLFPEANQSISAATDFGGRLQLRRRFDAQLSTGVVKRVGTDVTTVWGLYGRPSFGKSSILVWMDARAKEVAPSVLVVRLSVNECKAESHAELARKVFDRALNILPWWKTWWTPSFIAKTARELTSYVIRPTNFELGKGKPLTMPKFASILSRMSVALGAGKPIDLVVLLFDEILEGNEKTVLEFVASATQDPRASTYSGPNVFIVLSVLPFLQRAIEHETSQQGAARRIRDESVTRLPALELTDYIEERCANAAKRGLSVSFEARDHFFALTGGHPWLVNVVGNQAFMRARTNGAEGDVKITERDLLEGAMASDIAHPARAIVRRSLGLRPDAMKAYFPDAAFVRAICAILDEPESWEVPFVVGKTTAQWAQYVKQQNKTLDVKGIDATLQTLVRLDLAEVSEGRYRLVSRLMWIEVKSVLDEIPPT